MAAALDKDPVALEQEHLNTMKFLYGPHFEQGFAHVQQLPAPENDLWVSEEGQEEFC